MQKEQIIDILKKNRPEIVSRYGVKKLGLFGSFGRKEQADSSDIDILVSFARDIDLFEIVDLRDFLESCLQNKVDLVMETALKPAIGKRILSEVEYV